MADRRGYSRDGSRDSRPSSSFTQNSHSHRSSYESSHNSNRGNNASNSRDHYHQSSSHTNNDHSHRSENSTIIRVSYDIVNCLSAKSNAKVGEIQDKSGAKIMVVVLKYFLVKKKNIHIHFFFWCTGPS
jgi:ABC-type Zn2+ transport system substrate-binding protein/surface adhesin